MPRARPRLGKDRVQGGAGEPDVRPAGRRPGDALRGAAAREGCSGPLEGPGRTWSEDGAPPLSTQRRARPPSGERGFLQVWPRARPSVQPARGMEGTLTTPRRPRESPLGTGDLGGLQPPGAPGMG